MLGYISSTRKKSCRQCVKSKRRCNLGFPCCKRCFAKGLDCAYPNASGREAEVVIRQQTPHLAPLSAGGSVEAPQPRGPAAVDAAALLQGSASPGSDEHDVLAPGTHAPCVDPILCQEILTPLWLPRYLTEGQVMFMCGQLCAMVSQMAFSGHTPFIHEALYCDRQPVAYQDCCSLAALYLAKTERNMPILTRSIDAKIAAMIGASHSWSLVEHLAAVQALTVYQIIRLFDPDLGVQALADRQNRVLEVWTAHLWKRCFNEPMTLGTCYESWVFYESIRRTVLMSVFLRGAWHAVTHGGYCDQVPVLARLPLAEDGSLWECDAESFQKRRPCDGARDGGLVAYGDFSLSWKPGSDPEHLTSFQRLLLGACRGSDDPALFY